MIIPELFKYESPVLPDDAIFRISPSQIGKFFEYPKVWYLENIKGDTPVFKGSTATITGTICHYIYECLTKKIDVDRESINSTLDEYKKTCDIQDVNWNQIKADYPLVAGSVVNEYLLTANNKGCLIESEKQIASKVMDGIYVAGTIDRIEGDVVVDFKTVSTKPNESSIPFHYKIQLLSYAYALRKKGYEINRIRIVYGIKPTKTLPARCVVVTENIDYVSEQLMNNTLKLIAESVLKVRENPELTYLIFKSYDLKE